MVNKINLTFLFKWQIYYNHYILKQLSYSIIMFSFHNYMLYDFVLAMSGSKIKIQSNQDEHNFSCVIFIIMIGTFISSKARYMVRDFTTTLWKFSRTNAQIWLLKKQYVIMSTKYKYRQFIIVYSTIAVYNLAELTRYLTNSETI